MIESGDLVIGNPASQIAIESSLTIWLCASKWTEPARLVSSAGFKSPDHQITRFDQPDPPMRQFLTTPLENAVSVRAADRFLSLLASAT
jgi:hypothetical protein